MNLSIIGCSFQTADVALREKIAFNENRIRQSIIELGARFGCEIVVLSTCNRVELIIAKAPTSEDPNPFLPDKELIAEFLCENLCDNLKVQPQELIPHLYEHQQQAAIHYLFRVTSSLESMILGEGQIAGQVRDAFEFSQKIGGTGPLLNILFPQALRVSKRVRSETEIALGHVSVSSVAVDFVREVFDHFHDKTVLVIGAGKMGQLTLKHLRELNLQRILVTNRNQDKAQQLAAECNGQVKSWEELDDGIAQSDIILSTTGATEPIMQRRRFDAILSKRARGPIVILDIAVPRDFDPRIAECRNTYLFNIDDLRRISDQTKNQRRKAISNANGIIEGEVKKLLEDWQHRRHAPVIQKLTQNFDQKRKVVLDNLLSKLNGKLTDADKKFIEGAFRLFQNQLLHGPIDALREESRNGNAANLIEAVRKLFHLSD